MSSSSPRTDRMRWSEFSFISSSLSGHDHYSNDHQCQVMIIIFIIIIVRSWSLKSLSSLSALPGWAKPRRFLGTCSTESQSRCCTYLVPGHLLMKIMFFINRILMRDQNVCYWKYLFPFILIFIEILFYWPEVWGKGPRSRGQTVKKYSNFLHNTDFSILLNWKSIIFFWINCG